MSQPKCCKGKCSAKPPLRFQYGKRPDGQWYWRVRAKNSEIIAQGEGYKRKVSAIKVAILLFGESGRASIEEV